jgi:hypothetical protein
MAAHSKSSPEDREREELQEWEGGDPPCWAHLFEHDVFTVPIEATDLTAEKSDEPSPDQNRPKR